MKISTSFLTLATVTALLAIPNFGQAADEMAAPALTVKKAVAVLMPTEGSEVKGTITFEKVDDGMKVEGKVTGLTPGKHGFHVHEFGDLTSPDGKAAGGHFNPMNEPHAAHDAKMRHAGDLGNIEADATGTATIDLTDDMLTFTGPTSILGRGLVVHGGTDDMKTQPSGDAGTRVAVGVIGITKAE